jgi:indole-3-glycerol phosphate synthase
VTTASVPNLLGTILGATRRIVEVREAERPPRVLGAMQTRDPRGDAFKRAIAGSSDQRSLEPAFRVIAECKRRSPSRGILRAAYDPASHARAYAAAGAVAISVLTEPTFFDGALEHLQAVRAAVDVPLLRKDFIVSEYQLIEAAVFGADAVLLIVSALEQPDLKLLIKAASALGLAPLVEVHDEGELRRAVEAGATAIGVNSRNLRTLQVDLGVLDRLALSLPSGVTAVAESGIRSQTDLQRLSFVGYHAFLVGERLIVQPDPGAALQELVHG